MTQNARPNAYLLSPTIYGDLAALTTGDGTNAAKNWLTAPPIVSDLTPFPTENLGDDQAIIGDWTQLVFGIRHGIRLEVSTDASDFFTKHQVGIKLVWRGDIALLHENHFHLLDGITT
jgi:HK97 family phage major capsid protein